MPILSCFVRKFAFGHDEVAPLTQAPLDDLNGWGATIVDALDTMACFISFLRVLANPVTLVHHGTDSDCLLSLSCACDDQQHGLPRTSSMKRSISHEALTSRNRTQPTLSGKCPKLPKCLRRY